MISEIRIATLSVRSLKESVTFYEQACGFTELGWGQLDTKSLNEAWRMPPDLEGDMSIMGPPGAKSGLIRLIQFNKPGEPIFPNPHDYGHYVVNFRARDLRALWPELLNAGAVEKSPPTYWKLAHNVWDAQAFDPSGILLDIFEIELHPNDPLGEQVLEVSELQTMALHVADANRTKTFYEGLGYQVFYDKMVENMEEFFGFPPGTKLHNINLIKPECSPNGRIEIGQYVGVPGEQVRDRAVPPNTGILSISFATDDLDAAGKQILSLGGQHIGGPVMVEFPYLGQLRLATYFGPDGEALEFYQRV